MSSDLICHFLCVVVLAVAAGGAQAQPTASSPPGSPTEADLARPKFRYEQVLANQPQPGVAGTARMTSTTGSYNDPSLNPAAPAVRQYTPNYYGGTGGGWGWGGIQNPTGAAFNGMANMVDAEGQFRIANEQSKMIHEDVKQARLDTKRKSLEEGLYEREITPTRQDEIERGQYEDLRRARRNPLPGEVYDATALNSLMASITNMQRMGGAGPDIRIPPGTLENINFTIAGAGPRRGAGVLKNGPTLEWPGPLQEACFDDMRKTTDGLVLKAAAEAASGRVSGATLSALTKSIGNLEAECQAQMKDMSWDDSIAAKRYVRELRDSIQILKQPDVGKYLGDYTKIQANTVNELVKQMYSKGVTFAPAVSGEEGQYNALYNALANYEVSMSHQVPRTEVATTGRR